MGVGKMEFKPVFFRIPEGADRGSGTNIFLQKKPDRDGVASTVPIGPLTQQLKDAIIRYIRKGEGYEDLRKAFEKEKQDSSIWEFIYCLEIQTYSEWTASFLSLHPRSTMGFNENGRLRYSIVLDDDPKKLDLTEEEVRGLIGISGRFDNLGGLFPYEKKNEAWLCLKDSIRSIPSTISFMIPMARKNPGKEKAVPAPAAGILGNCGPPVPAHD